MNRINGSAYGKSFSSKLRGPRTLVEESPALYLSPARGKGLTMGGSQ